LTKKVKKQYAFLKVISHGNTYLEGEKYPTAACVIPLILSLEEHFTITKEEKGRAGLDGEKEIKKHRM
jgi:hypothetical protein